MDMSLSRRSFFRSLALIGAGVTAAPGIFIPKLEPVVWKVQATRWVVNPAWVRAEYTWRIYDLPLVCDPRILAEVQSSCVSEGDIDGFDPALAKQLRKLGSGDIPLPLRGNEFGRDGMLIVIPPFIQG
jgi:hypothetical protein